MTHFPVYSKYLYRFVRYREHNSAYTLYTRRFFKALGQNPSMQKQKAHGAW